MYNVRPTSTALAGAIFLAGWHALWSLCVAIGVAQPLLNLVFRLHMLTPVYQVGTFSLAMSAGLVALSGGAGYLGGLVAGCLWNSFVAHKTASPVTGASDAGRPAQAA